MSFQEEWVDMFKGYTPYICFDNDEAGHKGAIKVLEYLPDAKVVFIPKNVPKVKDISDYVAHGGDFHALMKGAKQYKDIEAVRDEMNIIDGQWGDISFHELFIENYEKKHATVPKDTKGKVAPKGTGDRIERAKSVPCDSLHEFRRAGRLMKGKCLWHDDRDPSLVYYPEKNNCYCFVCGKYADGIDIVQARDGVDIKQAIKTLLNE
jgi:DNA primase